MENLQNVQEPVENTAPVTEEVVIDQPTETDNTPTFDTYTIKHMDEEIVVDSLEKQQSLLNKGADYDRIKAKYDEASNDPSKNVIKAFADRYGLSQEEAVAELKGQLYQDELSQYAKDNGFGEDLERAKKFYELEKRDNTYTQKDKDEQAKLKREQDLMDFIDFQKEFYDKDITAEDIPNEVWEQYENGKSMTEAFLKHELKMKKEQAEIDAQNKKNDDTVIPDVTQHSAKDENVISAEWLANATPKEVAARWDEVMAFKNKK